MALFQRIEYKYTKYQLFLLFVEQPGFVVKSKANCCDKLTVMYMGGYLLSLFFLLLHPRDRGGAYWVNSGGQGILTAV